MTNYLKSILTVLVFLSSGSAFGWDTTAAKLYPLSVGNTWSYNYKTFAPPNGCVNLLTEINYIVRIVDDTLMPNGRSYFKFEDRGSFFYRRIDSSSMNIYQYSTSAGNECMYDSLRAVLNSTYSGCSSPYVVNSISNMNLWGAVRLRRESRPIPCPGCGRILIEGIGYYADYICLTSGNRTELNGCIINGIQYGEIIGITNISGIIPEHFSMSQNYPNPFNPITNVKFQIPNSGFVKLTVFDALGKEVQVLVNQQLSPGSYEVDFDGSNLPSGVYYYRLEVNTPRSDKSEHPSGEGNFVQTRKMVLIK